jgi:hypothetical protein
MALTMAQEPAHFVFRVLRPLCDEMNSVMSFRRFLPAGIGVVLISKLADSELVLTCENSFNHAGFVLAVGLSTAIVSQLIA